MLKWKTKSGETMFIHEMTTEHLKNATNLMARNEYAIIESTMQSFIKFAGALNGDASTMLADAIIDNYYGNDDSYESEMHYQTCPDEQKFDIMQYPPMEAMMKELKKRGVDHDPQLSERGL